MIEQVVGSAGHTCSWELMERKNGPLSKHTQHDHYLSLQQELLQKKNAPKVLGGYSQHTPPQDWSSAGWCHQYLEDQVVHSPGAVMIGVLNPGKMASRCVANILVPQVDLTPTDFHHQMAIRRLLFPISVLWVGDLCVQLVPHTPRGREFCH